MTKLSEADLAALKEAANLGNWLESRIHLRFTEIADGLFGEGLLTREERIALSGAIGKALDAFRLQVEAAAGHLYQRKPWEQAPEPNGGVSEAVVFEESASMVMPLEEKAVRADGTVEIKLIKPGWGSSGYYPAEVLQRDGATAFPKGTKMFWNHPTISEEAERPERDLKDLASELVTDAQFVENHPKGPGLYARAKVFETYKPAVDDLAGHIGTSIRARGRTMAGEAEGREGQIVTELLAGPFNTVDYVTVPGAGGEVITMFEAARQHLPAVQAPPTSGDVEPNLQEVDMDELQKLQEANAALQTQLDEAKATIARLNEALALRDATTITLEALGATPLPDVTKARLAESLAKNPPMKDGQLDAAAYKTLIEEAVKAEMKYLEQVVGLGTIRGLGESQSGDEAEVDEAKVTESLKQSFLSLGLSETAAEVAAKGRK